MKKTLWLLAILFFSATVMVQAAPAAKTEVKNIPALTAAYGTQQAHRPMHHRRHHRPMHHRRHRPHHTTVHH